MTTAVNPSIFLVCFWPFAFMVGWALWNSLRDSRDEKLVLRSLEWPEVNGSVTESRVAWAHVEVSYEYTVQGRHFTGQYNLSLTPVVPDRYGVGARQINSEAANDISQFPVGRKLIIRYNPLNLKESVFCCVGDTTGEKTPGSTGGPQFSTID